ncbi:Fibrobacter succinogenes major domain [compost metagenome]
MTEDLQVRTYRNGDSIFYCKNKNDWDSATNNDIPACCHMYFDSLKGKEFGLLYNWFAVDDPRGLAPRGYKIPNVKDWKQLISFSGGKSTAGRNLKASDGSWFPYENYVCEDKYNFKAKPSINVQDPEGTNWGKYGKWWTSDTATDGYFAKFTAMGYGSDECNVSEWFKSMGLTVRCLKK